MLQVALAGDDPFYAMEGPSLAGPLRRDCAAPVLRGGNRSSPVFSDPSVFPHAVWLSAVWTADGETVHGLVHDEYHGDRALNGTSSCPGTCWYTTVLQVVSTNGGRSFTYATSPSNPRGIAIASPVGYQPAPSELKEPQGLPNHHIVQDPRDGFIYILVSCSENAFLPAAGIHGGHCVYRSTPETIGDGLAAWHGWDGHGWNVTVVDPYASPAPATAGHLPAHVGSGIEGSGGIVFVEKFGLFVAVGAHCSQAEGQPPTMHVMYETSPNMTTWSGVLSGPAVPLLAPTVTCASIYPHLIDAASPSRNFDVIGNSSTSATVFFSVIVGDRVPGPVPHKQLSRAGLFIPVTIELAEAA